MGLTAHFVVTSNESDPDILMNLIETGAGHLSGRMRQVEISLHFPLPFDLCLGCMKGLLIQSRLILSLLKITAKYECYSVYRFVNGSIIVPTTRQLFFEIDAHVAVKHNSNINTSADVGNSFKTAIETENTPVANLTSHVQELIENHVDNKLRLSVESPR